MRNDSVIRQISWSNEYAGHVIWSTRPSELWHRFSIVKTASGYTVADHETGDLARVSTFALAKAWAGVRVNEQCVRH